MRRIRNLAALSLAVSSLLFGLTSCGGDDATGTAKSVARLRFILQPGTPAAGAPITVSVELLDSDGARLTSATDEVSLSITGGGVLGGTSSVHAIAGVATFSGITMSTAGQNLQLTAHIGNITALSSTFNVVAGSVNASQSAMAVTPGNPSANTDVALTFTLKDAYGNRVANVPVTFSANVAGITFTPATANSDANGSVSTTFRAPASGSVTITIVAAGASATFGTPINIGAGATSLRFVTQPTNVSPNQSFGVSVEIVDNAGQRMTSATNQVTLTLNAGALLGNTAANAVAGLATFTGLQVGSPGTGLRITATSGTLSVQSDAFNVGASSCTTGALTIGGTMNVSVSAATGCTQNGHQAASLRFTVPGGNATVVSMGATSVTGLNPELTITPDPANADAIIFTPTPSTPMREWLLAPGTYLANISSTNGSGGTFALTTINNGIGAPGCVVRILANVNATYAGQALANSNPAECVDLNATGGYYEDRFLVYDSRPCTITMTSTAFDTFLLLRDLALTELASDDDSGGNENAQITRTTCRNGTNPLIIAASSYMDFATGPYVLTISFGGAVPGPLQSIAMSPAEFPQTPMRAAFKRAKR